MRDHGIGARAGEKTQVLAAGRLVVRGEPFHLAGPDRPHVDPLCAESKHRSLRPPWSRLELFAPHPEHTLVPSCRRFDVTDVEHEMIERGNYNHGRLLSHCASTLPRKGSTFPSGNRIFGSLKRRND